MRKEYYAKRALSGILSIALCITAFTGCGKKKDDNPVAKAKEQSKEYVFKQESIKGTTEKDESVTCIDKVGDKIKAVIGTKSGSIRCVTFNPDGSDVQSYVIEGEEYYSAEECAFDNDGNLYVHLFTSPKEEGSSEDAVVERTEYLAKYDNSGNELLKVDVSKELTAEELEDNNFFIYDMVWVQDKGLVVGTHGGVETFDDANGFSMVMPVGAESSFAHIIQIVKGLDSQLYIQYDDEKFSTLDLDNKKLGEPIECFDPTQFYQFFEGEGHDLFAATSEGVFVFDGKEKQLVKVLDYNDSLISGGIYDAVALSDTEIIAAVSGDTPDEYGFNAEIVRLTKVNPEAVGEKIQLTMACFVGGNYAEKAASKFNKVNDKYSIKVINYPELYGSEEEGIKQFNLELVSGDAPDIIDTSGLNVSVQEYVNKGLLLDLTPAFEDGGGLDNIEFLPNLAEMMKVNGKIYRAIPEFGIKTYIVRERFAGGKNSFTYDECEELIKSKNLDYVSAFGDVNKNVIISYNLPYNRNKYIDWQNKKCSFNSPDFVEFLNFVNRFKDNNEEEDPDGLELKYSDDRAIFYNAEIYNLYEYSRIKQAVFSDEIAMVGCPNKDGENLAAIDAFDSVSVSSRTKYPEAAYDFIRFLFDDSNALSGVFPSNKAGFEKVLEEATKESVSSETLIVPGGGGEVKREPLSQEEAQKFYDYVTSINTLYEEEGAISNIIIEETSAFFSGQKTAEEVADIIQSRVNIYINENS